jgi:hypothetical protein
MPEGTMKILFVITVLVLAFAMPEFGQAIKISKDKLKETLVDLEKQS